MHVTGLPIVDVSLKWWSSSWFSPTLVCVFIQVLQRRIPPALSGISLGWDKLRVFWKHLEAEWREGDVDPMGSGKIPHAMEQQSSWATTTEPTLWSPRTATTEPTGHNYWIHALQQEKPKEWETHTPQLENNPCSPQLEKAWAQQQRPSITKERQKLSKT